MTDIEDQLRRYGDAVERVAIAENLSTSAELHRPTLERSRWLLAVAAVAATLVGLGTAYSAMRSGGETAATEAGSTATTEPNSDSPVLQGGISYEPPVNWTQFDRLTPLDGVSAPAVSVANNTVDLTGADEGCGVMGALAVALGPTGAYILVDEVVEGVNTEVPDTTGRPPSFSPAWAEQLDFNCGTLTSAYEVYTGVFWEGGRRFQVIVGVGPAAPSDISEAAWSSLDSLQIEPATSAPRDATLLPGRWDHAETTLSGSELVPLLVPTQDKLFVLFSSNSGGDLAGEIYDPANRTATAMAPSGRIWRHDPAVAWTGSELLVVGGSNGPGLDDLAFTYDPAADQWNSLPDPPDGLLAERDQISGPGIWTGAELVIWTANLAFDPQTKQWRSIAPYPSARPASATTVWTGSEIVVWGGCDAAIPSCDDAAQGLLTGGARYDPLVDTWTTMPPSPLAPGVHPAAAWTGDEILYYAGATPTQTDGASVASFDPATDTWQALPAPPLGSRRYAAMAWTGQQLVIWGGSAGSELADGAAWDSQTERWLLLPQPPPNSERDRHSMVWAGDHLYIVGGFETNGPIIFSPDSEADTPSADPGG